MIPQFTFLAKIQMLTRTGATETLTHSQWKCISTDTLVDGGFVQSKHTLATQCSSVFAQRSWKVLSTQKPCTQMSTTALSLTAKSRQQPRCPSVGKSINKMCHIQAMGYYFALK